MVQVLWGLKIMCETFQKNVKRLGSIYKMHEQQICNVIDQVQKAATTDAGISPVT